MTEENKTIEPTEGQEQHAFTAEQQEIIAKMIQSEADKVRNNVHDKYKSQLSEKEKELEEIKKAQMNEKERLAYEQEQATKELEEQRNQLKRERLELHAQKKINELHLSDEVIDLLQFDDEVKVDLQLEKLSKIINKTKEQTTQDFLKNNGTKPSSGNALNLPAKTFDELTPIEATELKRTNPQAYERLKANRKR